MLSSVSIQELHVEFMNSDFAFCSDGELDRFHNVFLCMDVSSDFDSTLPRCLSHTNAELHAIHLHLQISPVSISVISHENISSITASQPQQLQRP